MIFKFFTYILVLFFTGYATAQDLKVPKELVNKNITLVVGYGSGGTNDVFARFLTKTIKDNYDVNIVVINKPGANGAIAAKSVAESDPDGLTLHLNNDAYILGIVQNLPGWPVRQQMTPVAHLWGTYYMIIGSKSIPNDNLKDILADVKKQPSKYNYACVFVIDCLIFDKVLKSQSIKGVAEVPFKSGPETKNALSNNTVQFWTTGVGDGIATSKTGIVKPLAVTSPNRLKEYPDIPTLNEIMSNGTISNVTTVYVPTNTSIEIRNFYNKLFAEVLKTQEVKKFFDERHSNIVLAENNEAAKKIWDEQWIKVQKFVEK